MDSELSHAIEAYNLANIQLGEIDADLDSNGRHLEVAKSSLGVANAHIAKRLRALYINGDSGGAVEVILGAKSLDDLLDRIDMAQRVGGQDSKVLRDVRRFRDEVKTRRTKLRSDRAKQAIIVQQRAGRRDWIEGKLAERQRLLASVKDEIARMEEAERRRQALLEAQARARLEAAAAARAVARSQTLEVYPTPSQSTPRRRPLRRPSTAAWSASPCSTSAFHTCSGASPSGFDCSGSSRTRTRRSASRSRTTRRCSTTPSARSSPATAAPGDLVFFDGLGHMGMYIGGDQFIHAPHTGDVVKISSLSDSWYASTYVGAKRVTQPASSGRWLRRRLGDAFVQLFHLVGEVLEDDAALQLERRGSPRPAPSRSRAAGSRTASAARSATARG